MIERATASSVTELSALETLGVCKLLAITHQVSGDNTLGESEVCAEAAAHGGGGDIRVGHVLFSYCLS